MKSQIQINNSAGRCLIEIEGVIGVPEEWQFEEPEARVATYEKFRDTVRRIAAIDASEVVVEIRSTGGDVNDALLIHDALAALGARITTRCYGYTASAATIIAQAASPGCREISANALYLIHNSICTTEGNAAEIAGKLDLLRQTDTRIAAVYAARSGRAAEEFEALMAENNGNGRWLSPEEAVAAGLADAVVDAGERTEPSPVQNIVRGWRRLLAGAGFKRGPETHDGKALGAEKCGEEMRGGKCPADRNVLHFDGDELQRRAIDAARVAQERVAPTRTRPREDPSHGEAPASANQRAYAEDVRRFKGF